MVEEFLVEESEKMVGELEHLDEWLSKVEELGLDGQKNLTKQDKSPIPFLIMNKSMERVYETLCPQKINVKQFADTTIPLRVLSLIALAKQEQYFHEIQIWSDNSSPDPIAVGKLTDSYNSPLYIIARWGDELRSFAELKKNAIQKCINQKTLEFKKQISEFNNKLQDIDVLVEEYMNGDGWRI